MHSEKVYCCLKELQQYFENISQLGYKSGCLGPAHSSFCGSTMAKMYSLEETLHFILDQSDSEEGPENTEPDNPEDFTTDTEDETEFEEN